MKYYVARKSKFTGREEIKRTKCADEWCSIEYCKKYPDRIWKFSKQGAAGIVTRENKFHSWGYEFYIIPVND